MNTTAVTDGLLAIAIGAGAMYLRRTTPSSPLRQLWLLALTVFSVGALLGGALHTRAGGFGPLAWRLLYLLLGIGLVLVVAASVGAWRGDAAARRLLPFALVMVIALWLANWSVANDSPLTRAFAAGTILFAFGSHGALAVRRTPGAAMVTLGLAIAFAGALVQPNRSLDVQLIWRFDRNGLFHLLVLVALGALIRGLRSALRARPAAAGGSRAAA